MSGFLAARRNESEKALIRFVSPRRILGLGRMCLLNEERQVGFRREVEEGGGAEA